MRTTDGSRTAERGYDFLGVTKWLAERADVILLFFDPDKVRAHSTFPLTRTSRLQAWRPRIAGWAPWYGSPGRRERRSNA